MLYGVKIRLYPNETQENQLWQMFGNSHFVWNQMLNLINKRYENNPSASFLHKYALDLLLKSLKEEYPFLKKSDSTSFQIVDQNMDQAWKMYFEDDTHQWGKPCFHSRRCAKQSYSGKSSAICIVGRRYMKLPKLSIIKTGKVKFLEGVKIKRYTVVHDSDNRYYLALQVDDDIEQLAKTGRMVGIDVGLENVVNTSDGQKITPFKAGKFEKEIRLWQRKYDRRKNKAKRLSEEAKNRGDLTYKPFENYTNVEKAREHKARLQKKKANKRKDYLDKITTDLVRRYDVIVIEDLKVKNMLKNHKLARAIQEQSWYMFRRMLEYKCAWYGKTLVVVDPKYTTQMCSNCGHIKKGEDHLTLSGNKRHGTTHDEYICYECGYVGDRDINAAINILHLGIKRLLEEQVKNK